MSNPNATGPKTLSASGDTITIQTYLRAGSCIAHAQSSTSLVVTAQGSQDGVEWISLPTRQLDGTLVAAGSSIALATDDLLYIPAEGLNIIRLTYVSGTGVVSMRTSEAAYGDAGGGVGGDSGGVPAANLQADIDTTVAGNAITRTYTAPTSGARGQFIHNNSDTYSLWYKRVLVGGASSTIASTNKHGIILPGVTAFIELNPGFTLDLTNSTGAATTVDINGGEF